MTKIQKNFYITETVTKTEWEHFLLQLSHPPFLQAWYMQKMHDSIGEQNFAIAIKRNEDNALIGVAFATYVEARRGKYLFLPYGPVFAGDAWELFTPLTEYLKKKGRAIGADFLRSSPFIANIPENKRLYKVNGWKPAPIHLLAENLWWLNIEGSEDEIMLGMRKTMRNLIRKAGKMGVTIKKSRSKEAVDQFIKIHKDTVQRQGFIPYKDSYFHAQVDAFREAGIPEIFTAMYEGKAISSAIMMYYGDLGSYHHGASLSKYNKIPGSYLLQWEAIKEAKRRGCTKYNFWGIVPEDEEESRVLKRKHPWIGITKFKKGFGGTQFDLLHCQDLPLTPKYLIAKTIETTRKLKRGH